MMKYPHIMAALSEERWAIEQSKLQLILDFMADQSAGMKYDAAEIEARIGGQRDRGGPPKTGGIAVIPLRGVISNRMSILTEFSGGTSTEAFAAAFRSLVEDNAIRAIVIDVDSPGGAVSGTDELSSLIYSSRGRKPIVAHVNSTAASAAYWIATAADEIVVTPSGSVGSIGVLMIHEDVSGALEKAGIRKTIISAGERKTAGNPFAALPDDVRSRIQARIDSAYNVFLKTVARNRSVDIRAVREHFGKGEMVDAPDAVSLGMADRLETLHETVQRLVESNFVISRKRGPPAPERERRALALVPEKFAALRRELDEPPVVMQLAGMATIFDQVAYLEGAGLTEYLAGCFVDPPSVALLRDHNFSARLSTSDGVRLTKSSRGLMMTCDIRADHFGKQVVEAYFDGMTSLSIGTDIKQFSPSSVAGKPLKRVTRAQVMEVSLVAKGAFVGTSASLKPVGDLTLSQAVGLIRRSS